MPDYKRVLDKDTGHEYSELASVVDTNPDAYEVFDADDKDHPVYDHNGVPADPIFADPKKKSGQKATTPKENS